MGVPPWAKGLLRLTVCGSLAVIIGAMALLDLRDHLIATRGIESGLAEQAPMLQQPRWGATVALEQYDSEATLRDALEHVGALGLGAVRQHFAWAEIEPQPGVYRWDEWDRILPIVQAEGLAVIAILDTSPVWARPSWEAENPWAPPTRLEDYARFADALAARYGAYIQAYQVWDQPNIHPHWGQGPIAPSEYVQMLRLASEAIRRNDPDALVIAGGLAPNLESGGRNLSDVLFLREIYRRGAGAYFDILGVKAYGFWSGPHDRRVDEDTLNFSRVILLRQEMVRRGEAHKPIWALEMGWNALPADWQGAPSVTGSDIPFVQGERLVDALERVQREWPWMGLMCLMHLQPVAPATDSVWGYALLDSHGQPGPLYEPLRVYMATTAVVYPGRAPQGETLLAPSSAGAAELLYWGTDVIIEIKPGRAGGTLTMLSDVAPRQLDVSLDDLDKPRLLRWRSRDAPGMHRIRFEGESVRRQAIGTVRVGARRSASHLWLMMLTAAGACAWLTAQSWRAGRAVPWRSAWEVCQRAWKRLPLPLRWGLSLLALGMTLAAPTLLLRLVALSLYLAAALLQPEIALWCAVATIPLAPLTVRLGPASFAITEVALLAALGARAWSLLWERPSALADRSGRRNSLWLDGAVLGLVLLATVAALAAEYRHEAMRELRVVVIEPALLYLLLRTHRRERLPWMALIDALWLSAVGLALYALWRYPSSGGVIEAEGVRRARAFFGSPNNLALYLERVLPLGLAIAWWGRVGWRRWLYGLGSAPIALAMILTFSRGAWFLGAPAALFVLLWARGGRGRWAVPVAVLLAALAVAPLSRNPRLSSAFDLNQGTAALRVSLWQASGDMIGDHPWLGVGPDNFLYYYGDYIRPGAEADRWLSHPHNLVLDFWLRLGVGGLALLVALLGGFARRAVAWMRLAPDSEVAAASLGLTAGMAAAVAHGLIDTSYFVIELAYWIMFALAWVNSHEPWEGAGPHR
jgi:O-antigen ligase